MSSRNSGSRLFRRRYIWIIFIALILSVGLYNSIRFFDQPETISSEETETAEGEMKDIQPATFLGINEFTDGGVQKIRLSGSGEAGAVIVLTNRGERLRQIRINEAGQWGVTVSVEPAAMAIEAQLYKEEGGIPIRSDETIFRIPVPDGDEVDDENYKTSALIMVTAPGRPSRVIQSPFGGFPNSGPLTLSVIDYDYAGGVTITGTSSIPGRIRVYAQDNVIGEIAIGVSGRWSYIAGRMLPRGKMDIRAELIVAPGILNAPEGPVSVSVPFNFLPPLRESQTDGSGALIVNFEPLQWQVRRTLIGGGGQSTIIFSPEVVESEVLEKEPVEDVEVEDVEVEDGESETAER